MSAAEVTERSEMQAPPPELRAGSSVGCDLTLARFLLLAGAIGGQSGVADFVQQGAVADIQRARSLLAVPVVIVQDLQNDLAFERPGRLPGEFLERNGTVKVDFRSQQVRVARLQV